MECTVAVEQRMTSPIAQHPGTHTSPMTYSNFVLFQALLEGHTNQTIQIPHHQTIPSRTTIHMFLFPLPLLQKDNLYHLPIILTNQLMTSMILSVEPSDSPCWVILFLTSLTLLWKNEITPQETQDDNQHEDIFKWISDQGVVYHQSHSNVCRKQGLGGLQWIFHQPTLLCYQCIHFGNYRMQGRTPLCKFQG